MESRVDVSIGPGTRIGDVVVERELGTGAFGTVWLGRDTVIDRRVAVKVLRGAQADLRPEDRERFLAEARLVGSLQSPHIVTLHHIHRLPDDGRALEMEYVEGGSLEELLGEDLRLPVETAVRLTRGVLVGLARAHEAGVVHGDVKPGNVLLSADGTVKLADFGLARVLVERVAEDVEDYGARVAGTPHYMAPEVLLGAAPTFGADLWSVGVLLHRMLTGSLPFTGENLGTLFSAVQNAAPPPLPADVPASVADIVRRCLDKRIDQRFATPAEVADLLERALIAPARPSAVAAVPSSDLVGRGDELAAIDRTLASAEGGRGALIVVSGAEGLGKSAVLRAAADAARRRGFTSIQASGSAIEGILRPLVRSAREALRPADDLERAVDARRFGSATGLVRSLLAKEAGSGFEGRQQVVSALVHLLRGLASERPLAVWLDDLQRADPHETDVVADLAASLASNRVVIGATLRTGSAVSAKDSSKSARRLGDSVNTVRLSLLPLSEDAVLQLLERTAGGARIEPEVSLRIVKAAQGNPLFAVEFLRHLEDGGGIVRKGSHLARGPGWDESSIPRRLSDLVWSRLEALPESGRNLLEAAAVDGMEFDGQALASVLHRPTLAVLRQLQRLAREHGLLTALPRGFRFAHALVRDLLYEQVAPELRVALHRAFAEHLEARGDQVDPERLAVHWERAGDSMRARPHLVRACDRAIDRADPFRAIDLARRTGILPPHLRPEDVEENAETVLLLTRALANAEAPREEVEATYDLVLKAADARRDPRLRMRAIVRRAQYHFFRTGFGDGEAAQLRTAADLLPLGQDLGRARYLLGVAAAVAGDRTEAQRWLHSADEVFARLPGTERYHSSVLDRLASLALAEGRLREAERLYAEAAALSDRAGMATNAEASRINQLVTATSRGEVEALEAGLRRAIRTFELHRADSLVTHSRAMLAQALFALGRLHEAEAEIAEVLDRRHANEFLPALRLAQDQRAQMRLVRGDVAEARHSLSASRAAVERMGSAEGRVDGDLLEARILCAEGDPSSASRILADLERRSAIPPVMRAEIALTVAELAPQGISAQVIDALATPLDVAGPDTEEALGISRVLFGGAAEWARPTGRHESLRAAGAALRSDGVGFRRAVRKIVGSCYLAESARRAGDAAEALREATGAAADAERLGFVGLRVGVPALRP